jgi:hypothetical protein
MNVLKKLIPILSLVAALFLVPTGIAQSDKVSELMKKKLQHSQKVLEGIAVKDFKLIERNAEDLMQISKLAEWRVLKTPQYEVHSNDFRRTTEALIENAKKRNLDAAALNYVDMTLTCVRCHSYVREIRMTGLDGPEQ